MSAPPVLTATTSWGEAQRTLGRVFAEAGLDTASLDARLLLCGALKVDHAGLVRDPDARLGDAAAPLAAFAARRLRREPVSRILGRREFWSLPFLITPAVLDPRPDTEVVVETVLAALGPRRLQALTLLDLGAGSGALLCALLHECPEAVGLGVDRSFAACQVARANLAALGLAGRGAVIQGSWHDAAGGPFDLVVANPPYITHAELALLDREVADYDPPGALDGGPDGLDPYRAILPGLPRLLKPGGITAFEAGATQSAAIAAMMRGSGLAEIEVRRDLGGRARVVLARHPPDLPVGVTRGR